MEFKLAIDSGLNLEGKVYTPQGEAKRVILIIHGIGEHFGRYDEWAKKFTEKDYVVIGVDLPGHGLSPGRRGHIKNYHIYNDVIDSLASYAEAKFPALDIGLYGHSLGGNISLNYLLTNRFEFKFSIISSPWLILVENPGKAKVAIARLVNWIAPGLLQATGLKHEHISRVPKVNEDYGKDPLAHDRVSVRLGLEALDAAERILDTASRIDIPVLIVHGEDDLICSPEGSKQLSLENDKITLKLWKDGFHELHNESFNAEVFSFINDWIEKQS